VADIGLRGMKINVGGETKDAVAIYVGGKSGPEARAGQQIMDMVPCDEVLSDVLATVIRHLDLFKQVERDPEAKERVLMVPAGEGGGGGEWDPSLEAGPSFSGHAASTAASSLSSASLDRLAEGCGLPVRVAGRSLVLFRTGDGLVAVDAECPHEGASLAEGSLDDGCVVCPWHQYRFELSSGRCLTDPALSLKTYPATVENGEVRIELDRVPATLAC
jgi:nitrite reductase/ring-hydroxylating ferredoxin subunit